MNVFLLLGQAVYVDEPEELGIFSSVEAVVAYLRNAIQTGKIDDEDYADFAIERYELDNPENFECVPFVLCNEHVLI